MSARAALLQTMCCARLPPATPWCLQCERPWRNSTPRSLRPVLTSPALCHPDTGPDWWIYSRAPAARLFWEERATRRTNTLVRLCYFFFQMWHSLTLRLWKVKQTSIYLNSPNIMRGEKTLQKQMRNFWQSWQDMVYSSLKLWVRIIPQLIVQHRSPNPFRVNKVLWNS